LFSNAEPHPDSIQDAKNDVEQPFPWGDEASFYSLDNPFGEGTSSEWPEVERDHASAVAYVDMYIGQLISHLQRLGVDEDTAVFFVSDNGAHAEGGHSAGFFDSTGGLKGQKRSLYEGGVRSPSMVRWPRRIVAGQVSNLQWGFHDILPTVSEMAGVSLPYFNEANAKFGGTGSATIVATSRIVAEVNEIAKSLVESPQTLATNDLSHGGYGVSILPTLLGRKAKQMFHPYIFFSWNGGISIRVGDIKGIVFQCSGSRRLNNFSRNDTNVQQFSSDAAPRKRGSDLEERYEGDSGGRGDIMGAGSTGSSRDRETRWVRWLDVADEMRVYNLANDPFERHPLEGPTARRFDTRPYAVVPVYRYTGNLSKHPLLHAKATTSLHSVDILFPASVTYFLFPEVPHIRSE
jgi:hypothetical protein